MDPSRLNWDDAAHKVWWNTDTATVFRPDEALFTHVTKLDEGGQAVVYTATLPPTREVVVLKRTRGALDTATKQQHFLEEVGIHELAQKVAPRGTVPRVINWYRDAETNAGILVTAYAGARARTLHKRKLEGTPPLTHSELWDILRRVLEVLGPLHKAGIAHRDVHPHNIFVGDRIVLIDFGLACLRDSAEGAMGWCTPMPRTDHAWWVAPELQDVRRADFAAWCKGDVWGAATSVLWAALPGDDPSRSFITMRDDVLRAVGQRPVQSLGVASRVLMAGQRAELLPAAAAYQILLGRMLDLMLLPARARVPVDRSLQLMKDPDRLPRMWEHVKKQIEDDPPSPVWGSVLPDHVDPEHREEAFLRSYTIEAERPTTLPPTLEVEWRVVVPKRAGASSSLAQLGRTRPMRCMDDVRRFFEHLMLLDYVAQHKHDFGTLIVRALDWYILQDGGFVVVTDLVPKHDITLRQYSKDLAPTTARENINGILENILAQVVTALYTLHKHGLAHRALSPDTILVDAGGHRNVRIIMDQGCGAPTVDQGGGGGMRMAACESLRYKRWYTAPELDTHPRPLTFDAWCQADVWAAGMCMVRLAYPDANLKDIRDDVAHHIAVDLRCTTTTRQRLYGYTWLTCMILYEPGRPSTRTLHEWVEWMKSGRPGLAHALDDFYKPTRARQYPRPAYCVQHQGT